MTLTTPSLLFPAISLILLAFTNRFLGLSSVIRHLHNEYIQHPNQNLAHQIANLRRRVLLVRNMQIVGTASLILCVLCMCFVYVQWHNAAEWTFGLSLLLMLLSLFISVYEMWLSVAALNILLEGMEHPRAPWLHFPRRSKQHVPSNDAHHESPDDIQ